MKFREIYVSEGFPDLAVIVHPRVPAATVDGCAARCSAWPTTRPRRPILTQVKFKGFDPASDRDYDGVRRVYRLIGQ